MSDIEESAEFYYPDDNEDINSDKEIVNFLKESLLVLPERLSSSGAWRLLFGLVCMLCAALRNCVVEIQSLELL